MSTILEALRTAVQYHQAGQLQRAEQIYRQILQTEPQHPDALHFLGVIAHQVGQNEAAIDYIRRAIGQQPNTPAFHCSLGTVYGALGKPQEAVASCRRALQIQPDYFPAHNNLGIALQTAGKLDEAIACYQRALQIQPEFVEALNNLATALQAQAKFDEAVECYQRAVELRPGYVEAHSNLGNTLKSQGQLDEAVACYRRALEIRPDFAEVHNNLGMVLQDQGEFDAAVAAFQQALQIKPDYPEALNNLGHALTDLGRLDEAVASLHRALQLRANYAKALNNLGNALRAQGRYDQAELSFQRALQINPVFAEAHSNLGVVLTEQGKLDEAVVSFEQALRIKPDSPQTHNNLGIAFQDQWRLDEAAASYERALKIKPDYVEAHNNLGNALMYQGKLEQAIDHYRKAIALEPTDGRAYTNLAYSKQYSHVDRPEIERMEALLNEHDLPAQTRSHLHFALGKIRDDCGEWERAFAHYQEANQLANVRFDDQAFADTINALIENCNKTLLARAATLGQRSDLPIFIVGMPRSGTTLVEQILSSHPRVFGAGELNDIANIASDLPAALKSETPYPRCLPQIDCDVARRLADRYLTRIRAFTGREIRVTDKMPSNFLHLGLIALLLPNARVIHCRRHPLDVCISCYFQNFRNRLRFAYDLRSLGIFYRDYETLMDHWRTALPRPMFELDYEKLIAHKEEVSRNLVRFCGLDWHPDCIEFPKNPRVVRSASNWEVRQPIYSRSVGRWKHYEKFLDPLKEALGWSSSLGSKLH